INAIEPLTSAMSLDDAQGLFVNFNGERLPVVNNPTQKRLLGVVYKSALLERYSVLKRTLDASSEALLHFRRSLSMVCEICIIYLFGVLCKSPTRCYAQIVVIPYLSD